MNQITLGNVRAARVDLDESAKVYHLPQWKGMNDPARLATLRQIALPAGRDPRIATLAVQIMRDAGVKPREHRKAAAALLAWVQDRIFYVNEPGERLQDPIYTLRVGYGDCDDMALMLVALFESIRLPWRFVISGRRDGRIVRWMEGTPYTHANWTHIYVAVGDRPFAPTRWIFCEPTLKKPLGWDVVVASKGGSVPLPELAGVDTSMPGPLTAAGVIEDIRKELHPRKLITGVVVGIVTGIIAALAVQPIIRRVIPQRRR